MAKKIIIVRRWDSSPEADWYPWLKQELEKKKFQVRIPLMPDPAHPKIEAWVSKLKQEVKNPDEHTYFIGHSIGCQTILRYLEALPEKTTVGGVLCVAGWFMLQGLETAEEKVIARPWLERPINMESVRNKVKRITAIFSDDDPFVSVANAKRFEEKLGAKTILTEKQGHFNEKTAPLVLKIALEMTK